MKLSLYIYLFLLFIGLCTQSCYYDIGEQLATDFSTECDTEPVNYSNTIVPMFDLYCYSCHDSQSRLGGVVMDSYDDLLPYINNGSLLGSIEYSSEFSPMPPNGTQLNDCEIQQVRTWLDAGFPNN